MLVGSRKAAEADSKLKRIDPGVEIAEAGVRNMHEAKLNAPIVLALKKVQAKRAAGREIYARSAGRHIGIGEESAASKFEVGNYFAGLRKVPFERERI